MCTWRGWKVGVLTLRGVEVVWDISSIPWKTGSHLSRLSSCWFFNLVVLSWELAAQRWVGLLPAQSSPGGFPEDNGVMQTGREQLMGYLSGSNQGNCRGRKLALALVRKGWWKAVESRVDKMFGGFSWGLGLQGRIICSWRLKRLRTSSWEMPQHLYRWGAEGMLLYLSMTIEGLRNLWMREKEGGWF